MKFNVTLFAVLLAVSVAGHTTSVRATVIDFETATTGGSCNVGSGGSVGGFTLSPYTGGSTGAGFNSATACSFLNPTAHSGNKYMVNWNSNVGSFTKDAGTFELNSVWVHKDIRVGATTTVRFQGLTGVGGSVLNTLDVVLGSTWQQVVFTGWTNIKTFTWDSLIPGTSNITIDDFAYDEVSTPVPAPGALALLGLGLLGLGGLRRKRAA